MSFFVRNNSGGVDAIPQINVFSIADGALSSDLVATVAATGEPLNYWTGLYAADELRAKITAGSWAVVVNGVDLSPAEGIAALDAAAQRATNASYANTLYVDASGDPAAAGDNPSQPTTLANALSSAVFSTNIILAEGVYTTGAGITIPQDNLTLTARQGGTQSNSVIIQDAITLGPGRTRFRAYGVRFDGGFADSSAGRHYFSACSAGGGTYSRTNPSNSMVWKNCDFASMPYTATGVGSGSLTVEGAATVLSTMSNAVAGASIEIHEAITARITMTAGTLTLSGARVQDPTLAIDASAGTTVTAYNTRLTDGAGAAAPATLAGDYALIDVTFEPIGSTLGTESGTPSIFSADTRYSPAVPANYSPAVTKTHEALDQLAARPAPTAFGAVFEVFTDTTPTTISGLGFVPVLPASVNPPVNTTVLPVGTYEVEWRLPASATSGVGRFGGRISLDTGSGFAVVGDTDSAQAGTSGAPVTTVGGEFSLVLGTPTSVGILVEAADYSNGTWSAKTPRVKFTRTA